MKTGEVKDKSYSVVELLERAAKLFGHRVALRQKRKKKETSKTYFELKNDSKKIASYLLSKNLKKGHIAVVGSACYEWLISYFGTMYASLVVVPLDKELTAEELTVQCEKAEVDYIFYDIAYSDYGEHIMKALDIDGISFKELEKLNFEISSLPPVDRDKLAAVVFTSGTTGKSKGVMLSQRNFAEVVNYAAEMVRLKTGENMMSILPINHTYEMTCTYMGMMLYRGITICISSGLKYLQQELKYYKPSGMFIVPLFAETFYKQILLNIKKQNKEKAFAMGAKICGIARVFGVDLTDKFFGEIKEVFGGNLKILTCGGARLDNDLIDFYKKLNINLYQGYGLTECAPLLAGNYQWYQRKNSVGQILGCCEGKIVDGEIWAKGTSIALGYYNDKESTEKSFSDGWFKTGDLGRIDKDGFVYITGRKKNLIILSNGKNVSSEELEDKVLKLGYVEEAVVYSKDDDIIAEVYSPNKSELEERIDKDIAFLNKNSASYKRIAKVQVRTEPFPKTSTRKIKRQEVLASK